MSIHTTGAGEQDDKDVQRRKPSKEFEFEGLNIGGGLRVLEASVEVVLPVVGKGGEFE
jgi:hypothetical protein